MVIVIKHNYFNKTLSIKMASKLDQTSNELKMVQDVLYDTVDEIMQNTSQLGIGKQNKKSNSSNIVLFSKTRLHIAVTVLSHHLMPAVLRIYYIYLRNQQTIVNNLRDHLLPTLIAFLANSVSTSLASVQKTIAYPLARRPIVEGLQQPVGVPEKSVDCQVLFMPADLKVRADVIFIHGLHGGVDRTWRQGRWRHSWHKLRHQTPVRRASSGNLHVPARNGSLKRTLGGIYSRKPTKAPKRDDGDCEIREEGEWEVVEEIERLVGDEGMYSNCWPQDWIPKDCPGVRVIALNYTTDLLWAPVWKKKRERTDMVERSDEMIEALIDLGVGKQPIVWVGHSKGGLYIKQIVLNVWERHRDKDEIFNIFENTKGIMFYSVPHKGSSLADFTLPLLRRSVELIEVQRNCDFVLDLHKRFLNLCNQGLLKAEIFSFIETSFTLMSFVFLKIVAYESADPDIGIKCDVPLDHREICKPAGRDCFLYLELIKIIKKFIENGDST